MRTYLAYYRKRVIEVTAETKYAAQEKAAKEFGARRSWEVMLAPIDRQISTSEV